MASSSSSAAAPTLPRPPWVILDRIAHVLHDFYDISAGVAGDLSLALAQPPRSSRLTVPTSLHPSPSLYGADRHPYVLAANDAGLLLLVSRSPSVGFNLDRDPPGTLLVAPARGFLPADATTVAAGRDYSTCAAVRVPDREVGQCRISTIKSVGFLPLPGGAYVIAELFVATFPGLYTFRSGSDEWVETTLTCPIVSGADRPWVPHDVVSHAGSLWWVDLARGLLGCNPIAEPTPALRYVALPDMVPLGDRFEPLERIDRYRMVREVGGRLRFVDVARSRRGTSTLGDTVVAVWTLTLDPPGDEGLSTWRPGDRVTATLSTIWDDETYFRMRVPKEAPLPALVHPANPDVVFFFLRRFLFSLDVRHGVVVECARNPCSDLVLAIVPQPPINWRYVLAWVPPPSFLSAHGDEHHSSEGPDGQDNKDVAPADVNYQRHLLT